VKVTAPTAPDVVPLQSPMGAVVSLGGVGIHPPSVPRSRGCARIFAPVWRLTNRHAFRSDDGGMGGMSAEHPESPQRVKLTYDDFVLFPDDGMRHELIDGEHHVTPSPNTKHQTVSGNLYFLIRSWLDSHPAGRIFSAPFDVVFSKVDVVEPDLVYVSHERSRVLTAANVQGAPDIVIEIGSPGTRRRDETIERLSARGRTPRARDRAFTREGRRVDNGAPTGTRHAACTNL
jgi:hypothetical protein